MPKTVEQLIEKSRNLAEGMRKHLQGKGGGVTNDEISAMEQSIKDLLLANAEVDQLRLELTHKVRNMHAVMSRLNAAYIEKKKTLKGYYPQARWPEYGIPDKK